MDSKKRKRLEAKGWKVGTVSDFLGLSKEEEELIELKLQLAETVKKHRKRKKLTQEELAQLMHSSQSRVAKMEAGDPSVSFDLLLRTLIVMGVKRSGIARAFSNG
jgi:predicted XRE-type DNA-binding protein